MFRNYCVILEFEFWSMRVVDLFLIFLLVQDNYKCYLLGKELRLEWLLCSCWRFIVKMVSKSKSTDLKNVFSKFCKMVLNTKIDISTSFSPSPKHFTLPDGIFLLKNRRNSPFKICKCFIRHNLIWSQEKNSIPY